MIARLARGILCGTLLFAVTASASAECISEFVRSVGRDTQRRCCWPQPFVYPDRQAARAPFGPMVAKGWERQNTLDDFHFDPRTGELTEAGQLKLQSIVFDSPEQHRQVFVHASYDRDAMSARMQSVNTYLAKILPDGDFPPVMVSRLARVNWPADQIDSVGRKFQQSIPEPRLPPKDTSTTAQ